MNPLTAQVVDSTTIKLVWTRVPGLYTLSLYRATVAVQPGAASVTLPASTTMYFDHGLQTSTNYYYWLMGQ